MNNEVFIEIMKHLFSFSLAIVTVLGNYSLNIAEKIGTEIQNKINSAEFREKAYEQVQNFSKDLVKGANDFINSGILDETLKDSVSTEIQNKIKETVDSTIKNNQIKPVKIIKEVSTSDLVKKAITDVSQNLSPSTQSLTGLPEPFNTLLNSSRDAVVNILCTSVNGGMINVTTGSGVIIDKSGLILTNAHVAQDLLFTDPSNPPVIDCVTRQGQISPSIYKTSVLYIPLDWAQKNVHLRTNPNPRGNGDGDYAILSITKNINGEKLPTEFPFVKPLTKYRDPKNEQVLAIGYPAESIKTGFQSGVPLKYAITHIDSVFTLNGNTPDVMQTSPNVVAERGSSGGAVVSQDGLLLGLIESVQGTNTQGSLTVLQAISLPYIISHLSSRGFYLEQLAGDPESYAEAFITTGQTIRSLVE